MNQPQVSDYVGRSSLPILPIIEAMSRWEAVSNIRTVISSLLDRMDLTDYIVTDQQAVHTSARIGTNATLAPGCLIPSGTVVRRGTLVDQITTE